QERGEGDRVGIEVGAREGDRIAQRRAGAGPGVDGPRVPIERSGDFDGRRPALDGADVDGAVLDARSAPLIGRVEIGYQGGGPRTGRGAAGRQGRRVGWPADRGELAEQRGDAHDVATLALHQAAGGRRVVDQVVAAGDRAGDIAAGGAVGDDGVV